jgi:lipopolysaccharide/colanic/teichoic acid biosynthesis glycosyltransferase
MIAVPSRRYLLAKRVLDLTLSLLAVVVLAPMILLLIIAVRIDSPGPVFFVQERTGRHGRRFKMLKFRTMVINAEELKASLQHLNILPPPDFKIPDDPRITRVGRLLRATSLDELPQLLNVVRGDMSLVGPRPTSFKPSTYDLWHTARLDVIPGVTGLWQIEGRNEMTFDERLRLDVKYIRNRSLFYDIKLIALTFGSVFNRAGK